LINVGPDKGSRVIDLIKSHKPKILVELGTYIGYSSILFGDTLKEVAKQEGWKDGEWGIWSLEFDPNIANVARSIVSLAGLDGFITILTGAASDSLKKLKSESILERIDLLFIDHKEDLYVADLKVCEELEFLKKGSVVVADNVLIPGAPEYRKYVREKENFETEAVKGLVLPGEMEVSA
jgi:catechol O-methyltransferase